MCTRSLSTLSGNFFGKLGFCFAVFDVWKCLAENYSQKMLKLLYTAYSTISVSDAAGCLGMTEQEVVSCKYFFLRALVGSLPLELCIKVRALSIESTATVTCLQADRKIRSITVSYLFVLLEEDG